MQDFIAIDFETANPKRVSACAIGYAKVSNSEIVESNGYLIRPVGGHAPFQSKIHGIKEEHTCNKPEFDKLFPEIQDIFAYPLVAHTMFDKQVLSALVSHFNLDIQFDYVDSCSIAQDCLPNLKNHKLETLVKHFKLPAFKHHDAAEDAAACAKVFLRLQELVDVAQEKNGDERSKFKGLIEGILADDEVNYKEAYQLLYWLEDHIDIANENIHLFMTSQEFLADDYLNDEEAHRLKKMLKATLRNIG